MIRNHLARSLHTLADKLDIVACTISPLDETPFAHRQFISEFAEVKFIVSKLQNGKYMDRLDSLEHRFYLELK